mmetsp:Transcript_17969/g.49820  ORF Transcript_17969/g.49820 Transcript_17969/m.49820 type:complete len:536 (-) Transcript_17969:92-1699(-)
MPLDLSRRIVPLLGLGLDTIFPVDPALGAKPRFLLADILRLWLALHEPGRPRDGLGLLDALDLRHAVRGPPPLTDVDVGLLVEHFQQFKGTAPQHGDAIACQESLAIKDVDVLWAGLGHARIPHEKVYLVTVDRARSHSRLEGPQSTLADVSGDEFDAGAGKNRIHDFVKLHHVGLSKVVSCAHSRAVTTHDYGEGVLGHHGVQETPHESVEAPLGGPPTVSAVAPLGVLFRHLGVRRGKVLFCPVKHFHALNQSLWWQRLAVAILHENGLLGPANQLVHVVENVVDINSIGLPGVVGKCLPQNVPVGPPARVVLHRPFLLVPVPKAPLAVLLLESLLFLVGRERVVDQGLDCRVLGIKIGVRVAVRSDNLWGQRGWRGGWRDRCLCGWRCCFLVLVLAIVLAVVHGNGNVHVHVGREDCLRNGGRSGRSLDFHVSPRVHLLTVLGRGIHNDQQEDAGKDDDLGQEVAPLKAGGDGFEFAIGASALCRLFAEFQFSTIDTAHQALDFLHLENLHDGGGLIDCYFLDGGWWMVDSM